MLKKEILRGRREFNNIYRRGKSVPGRYVVLFSKKNNLPYNRLAFLASKKVGNSVQRNRAKRLLRESYRNIKDEIPIGYDMIFIARNSINNKKLDAVSMSVKNVIQRSGLYDTNIKNEKR